MTKEYEINDGTLAIISMDEGCSKVIEDDNSYIVGDNAYNIIDHSCRYFGSSYNGRKEGSKSIIGQNYKLPIVIEDSMNIIFFPTASPDEDDCIWLAVNKIKSYEEEKYNTTKIIFNNNQELIIPSSYRSIQNQIYRATRLSYIMKNHREMKF